MNSPYCNSCITHCLPFSRNPLPGLLVPLTTAKLEAQDLAHCRFIRNTYLVSEEELSSDTKPLSPLFPPRKPVSLLGPSKSYSYKYSWQIQPLLTRPANTRAPQGPRAGNGLHIVSDVPDHKVITSEIMRAWLTPNSFTHSLS